MNIANQRFFRLDPRCFKAFVAVAEVGHFTHAAEKAAMTQSSVSQHVARLEEQLGFPLFKRTAKSVVLTEIGEKLLAFIQRMSDFTAEFFDDIHQTQAALEGVVKLAMPPSCMWLPQISRLWQQAKQQPGLELEVELASHESVLKSVLSGRADFALVSGLVRHVALDYLGFAHEEYLLVASDQRALNEINTDNLLEHRFVAYPGMAACFDAWKAQGLPNCDKVDSRSLRFAGEIGSVEGALQMVLGGLGFGVFPRHCVQQLIKAGQLWSYEPHAERLPQNTLYLVKLKKFPQPRRVEIVMSWLESSPLN